MENYFLKIVTNHKHLWPYPSCFYHFQQEKVHFAATKTQNIHKMLLICLFFCNFAKINQKTLQASEQKTWLS